MGSGHLAVLTNSIAISEAMSTKTLALVVGLFAGLQLAAQSSILYTEDFDSPPHSVTSYHTLTGAIPYWNDTSALSVSSPNSFHANWITNDTVAFKTFAFSTQGYKFITLTFDHIAKVQFEQRAYVAVSRDNGLTWYNLTSAHYRSSFGSFGLYFNEASYSNPNQTPYWGGLTTWGTGTAPTNAWWKNEVFDISSIAGVGPSGVGNGYGQVLVRFSLEYRTYPGFANSAGWFVDNVKVTGSNCDANPPTINWNYLAGKKPIGARFTGATTVQFRAVDAYPNSNAGIDSAFVHYRLNGGAWNTIALASTVSCADSSEFIANLWMGSVGDTMDYWVSSKECTCASNAVRDPAAPGSYYTIWRAAAPPAMCGTVGQTTLPYVVTSVPFTEDFEGSDWVAGGGNGVLGAGHRGQFPIGNPPTGRNYEVSPVPTANGYAWSVRQGQSPAFNAGPQGDHTTGNGRYLYTESSQGGINALTTFTTPCIRLENLNHAALEFYYHKFGAQMGALRVDIDTGTGFGIGSGVIGAITLNGTTHTSKTDVWNSAVLNLQPYLNKYIRVRFVGSRLSATSDMAIDDIGLFEAAQTDVKMLAFIEPNADNCCYGAANNVTVRVANRGWQQPSVLPLGFSVKNLTTGAVVVKHDTVPVTWLPGGTATVSFADKANLSAVGNYELRAWVELGSDTVRRNDTTEVFALQRTPSFSLPYYENFDGPLWQLGQGSIYAGTLDTTSWQRWPLPTNQTGNANTTFYVGQDLTPVHGTGPRWSRKNKGKYVYVNGAQVTPNGVDYVYFESAKCFDFSSATAPVLSFWYHMAGAGCGSFIVEYLAEGSSQWVAIPSSTLTGPVQQSETLDWQHHQVAMTGLAGLNARLRIRAATSGTSSLFNMAIDELFVYDRPAADVGVLAISAPGNSVSLMSPLPITVAVKNFGLATQSAFPVGVVIEDLCTPSQTSYFTVLAPSIAPGQQTTVTFPAGAITYTPGDMRITAFTGLTGDGVYRNDTAYKKVNGQVPLSVPFGPITFDNCSFNEYGFFVQGGLGTLQIWEMGESQRGIPAYSGQNAWHLGLTQDGYGPNSEYLRFPPIVGLDTIYGATLQFKNRRTLGISPSARIEYLDGAAWLPVYDYVPKGLNWYQAPTTAGTAGYLLPAWRNSTNSVYETSSFPLDFWSSRSQPLVLRARFEETFMNEQNHWSIDDIEVVVPPQNSLTLLKAAAETVLLEPGDSTRIRVQVQNDAERPISSCVLYVHGAGSAPVQQSVTFPSGGLSKGQSAWVTLPATVVLNTPGTNVFCVSVERVNGRLDAVANSDSLCVPVVCLSPVNVASSAPFCSDFESADWPTESFGTESAAWVRGTPNHGTLQAAHNGTMAYATGNALYPGGAMEALYSPRFIVDTSLTYELSMFHNMQSEPSIDGGMLQYSFDDVTWHQLGNTQSAGAQNWCTTSSVAALNGRSGWSGMWSGYAQSSLRFESTQGSVRVRWLFASSERESDYGWAVDQFCLSVSASAAPATALDGSPDTIYTGCY